jgi:3-phosphoshikimate 1-carboxyvinyltransferase
MEKYKLQPLSKPIDAVVEMPGSKSYTNRALIMAALADGTSVITGISESDDSIAMVNALKTLGVEISIANGKAVVIGNAGKFKPFSGTINVGAAGTTMRFLTALVALVEGEIILDGSERMRERPINELVDALRSLGVEIQYLAKENCPPLLIKGGNIEGGNVLMKGEFSSQYFTSLLLIAPVLKNGLNIEVVGEQVSKSYIDMTSDGLKSFGVEVKNNNYKNYQVEENSNYKATTYHIEGDCSGAAYLWSIPALVGGKIRVTNINPDSAQGDVKYPDLLSIMGCVVVKNNAEKWIEVSSSGSLQAIASEIDMESMPDTAQPLAVVASFAEGTTSMYGLSTLRIKETDRIQALHDELKKCGIVTEVGPDWIKVDGGEFRGAEIETYKDHRMAMSFALAGLKVSDVVIIEPNVVSKSFPEFWDILVSLGVKIEKY